MAELEFTCLDATPERYAAAPTLRFRLRIREHTGVPVHTAVLRCQIRIEPHRRDYTDAEASLLTHLFGDRARWADTVKPMPLATVSAVAPSFTGATDLDLPVPCSYDLEVATGKYLHALAGGQVPLLLLFSGTVFLRSAEGFQVEQVPWRCEATYRMPAQVWRDLMDSYFPGGGWLRLRRETIDALLRYTADRAIPDWNDALLRLISEDTDVVQARP